MNKDIRLLISFKGHRKRKRLEKKLGAEGVLALIDLWLTVAQDRPDGILKDWDEEDIYIASGYPGDHAEFVKTLLECKFLKINKKEIFVINDWDEHQGWACGAKQRSEAASKAAKIRWKKRTSGRNTVSNAVAKRGHQDRNAPSPSPSPSPSLKSPHPVGNIEKQLKRIEKRWPKVHTWIGQMLKHNKNKEAIRHVLNRIEQTNPIDDYYAFASKIMSVEDGNYNEQEFRTQEAERQKKEAKEAGLL